MSRPAPGRPVTQMEVIAQAMGNRCGNWLRAAWTGSRRKHLANLLGISEAQAKRLLLGAPPTTAQLGMLANVFGWRFVETVFEPAVGTPAMMTEMQGFEQRLARLEAERRKDDAVWSVAAAGARADRGGEAASLGGADAAAAVPVPVATG